MKKYLFSLFSLFGFLFLIFIIIFFYSQQKISELDYQLQTLAKNQLENTFFQIDNDKFDIKLSNIDYVNDKKKYLKSLNNELVIYYDIFINNKHVGKTHYSINISRNSVNQEYFINNKIDDRKHRTSIAELYISFIDFYYNLTTETDSSYNSYIAQEEDMLAYNDVGILTKTGIVHYLISFNNSKKKTTFESEFIMSKFGEELLIPVKITYKES